ATTPSSSPTRPETGSRSTTGRSPRKSKRVALFDTPTRSTRARGAEGVLATQLHGSIPSSPPGRRSRRRTAGANAAARSEPERVERLRARREENALRLEVELERVDRELPPEARLLVAAERDPREGRVGGVDPDHARLDRACE